MPREGRRGTVTIINTAGWIQGLGLRYLDSLLQFSKATDIVQATSNAPLNRVLHGWKANAEGQENIECTLHQLPSISRARGKQRVNRSLAAKSPAELRVINLVKYFEAITSPDASSPWDRLKFDPFSTDGRVGKVRVVHLGSHTP